MHDAGAVIGGDEIPAQHLEGIVGVGEVGKRGKVAHTQKLRAGIRGEDLGVLPQFPGVGVEAGRGENIPVAPCGDHHVLHARVHRDRLV